LKAAEGEYLDIPAHQEFPVSGMKSIKKFLLEDHNEEVPNVDSVQKDIENTHALIKSGSLDEQILGLEALCCLTDPLKSSLEISMKVSNIVIRYPTKIQESLLSMLLNDTAHLNEEASGHLRVGDPKRFLILSILSNAMSTASKENCLAEAISHQEEWFTNVLVPCLIEDIRRAKSYPHQAHLAAKCLSFLVPESPAARTRVLQDQCVLDDAKNVGHFSHSCLESELKRVMSLLA